MQDISERKKLEDKYIHLADEFEDLYKQAPCAYFSLDSSATFLKTNAKLCEWLGCTAEELLGKRKISDFLSEPYKSRFPEKWELYKQLGSLKDIKLELQSRQGATRQVILNSSIAYDGNGRFHHSRSMMTDVTPLKEAEELVRKMNDELEIKVKQRTEDLAHKTADLEAFTYSLSHDLRAPLRGIQTDASILLEDRGEEVGVDERRRLERIQTASEQMTELMDSLLALSKLGKVAGAA